MDSTITLLYAGILGLFLIYLSISVIKIRAKEGIVLGTEKSTALQRAARAQSNFTEYTPIFLILLFLSEMSGAFTWFLHLSGATFLLGRVLHTYSLNVVEVNQKDNFSFRKTGMIITFVNILVNSVFAVLSFFT